jgi:hypothetical protein
VSARTLTESTCKEIVELVTEYLSHALSAEDRVRFEQHLLICSPCAAHLDQVRSTIELASRLRDARAPHSLPELLAAFRRRTRQR